jgi:hypothetical protein
MPDHRLAGVCSRGNCMALSDLPKYRNGHPDRAAVFQGAWRC